MRWNPSTRYSMRRVPVIQANLGISAHCGEGTAPKNWNMSWSQNRACYQTLSHLRQSLVGAQYGAIHLFPKKRKQFSQFRFVRAPAVFTDFKRFGVFDLPSAVVAVQFLQLRAKAVRD